MRKPRLEYQGALYHVIARGNHRQRVFLEVGDYVRYLKYLGETLSQRDFKLYAYCLMGNHVHLLLGQCSESPLSRVMQRLQTAYTFFFNKKYDKSGHLFQGRYKSILVDSDAYLLQLVRYIHLNPRRAKIEEVLGKYPWSSHAQYVRKEEEPLAPVEAWEVLKMFSKIKVTARKRYQEYMLEGLEEGHRDDLYDLREGRILGGEAFARETLREAGTGERAGIKVKKTVPEFWGLLLQREGIREAKGHARSRLIGEAAFWMIECAGKRQKELADHFGVHPTTINKALKKQENDWRVSPEDKAEKEKWVRRI